MNNDLYQHEAVQQLAKEFGLQKITAEELSESEITRLLGIIETERANPNHYPPEKWVKSWLVFLRRTGKYPRC